MDERLPPHPIFHRPDLQIRGALPPSAQDWSEAINTWRPPPTDTELQEVSEEIEKYFTLEEVAHLTGYSVRTIRGFISKGEIEAVRWGRMYRLTESSLRTFIESREALPVPEAQRPGREAPPRERNVESDDK